MTEILNVFIAAFSGGFERLRPAIDGLLHALIAVDVVLFFVMLMFGLDSIGGGLRKLLALSIWTYVARDFDHLATALVDSLVQAGLIAAGHGGANARLLMNPSKIFDGAFKATEPIANHVLQATVFQINGTWLMFGFTYIVMTFAYWMLAFTAFVAVIEYYLALSLTGILMPFGVLAPTRWIAMKPASYFLSTGIKLMVVAFLVTISSDVLGRIQFTSAEPTFRELWIALCSAATIGFLCWVAPQRLASGFMAGATSLGGSDAVSSVGAAASGIARLAAPVTSATQALLGKGASAVGRGLGAMRWSSAAQRSGTGGGGTAQGNDWRASAKPSSGNAGAGGGPSVSPAAPTASPVRSAEVQSPTLVATLEPRS